MKFTKMHGIGNDYVYVSTFSEKVDDPSALAVRVSDRHFGIGSDGLILIKPSERADFEMDMYNADGSRGKMCGNGIRCVAKYVYDHGLTDKTTLAVDTLSGIKILELFTENGKVRSVKVDMGIPETAPAKVPLSGCADPVIGQAFRVPGLDARITCISMGCPHCVVEVDDPDSLDLEKIGPAFEHHSMFPEGVNTDFVRMLDEHTVQMRVWERGSGETLACGTGACASAAAAVLNGWTNARELDVKLRGGDLHIFWDRENTGHIFMTGPAVTVFEGEIE